MKKYILLPLLSLITGIAIAQGPPDPDKIEALRVAFLTKYLDLSTEEAQKFWPVYNTMQKEIEVIRTKEENLRNGKKVEEMTDEELNKLINEHFDNEQKLLDIKRKYLEEYKKVLPLKKVALLADAENAFRRELMQHAKDKHNPGGGKPEKPEKPAPPPPPPPVPGQ